jgi:hypothetical protein
MSNLLMNDTTCIDKKEPVNNDHINDGCIDLSQKHSEEKREAAELTESLRPFIAEYGMDKVVRFFECVNSTVEVLRRNVGKRPVGYVSALGQVAYLLTTTTETIDSMDDTSPMEAVLENYRIQYNDAKPKVLSHIIDYICDTVDKDKEYIGWRVREYIIMTEGCTYYNFMELHCDKFLSQLVKQHAGPAIPE